MSAVIQNRTKPPDDPESDIASERSVSKRPALILRKDRDWFGDDERSDLWRRHATDATNRLAAGADQADGANRFRLWPEKLVLRHEGAVEDECAARSGIEVESMFDGLRAEGVTAALTTVRPLAFNSAATSARRCRRNVL